MPHAAAKDFRQRALKDPSLFILREKTVVKLDLNGLPDASQRDKVEKDLTKLLENNKCSVGANGTITLVAAIEGPTTRKVTFLPAGTFEIKEWGSKLKFVYNGEVVWQTSASNVPGMVRGSLTNFEAALREYEKPN